jgi:hypothetical protein
MKCITKTGGLADPSTLPGGFLFAVIFAFLIQHSATFSLAWWLGAVLGVVCMPGLLVALVILLVIAIAFCICYGLYELVQHFIFHA